MYMYIFALNILCIHCSKSSIFFVQSWRVEHGTRQLSATRRVEHGTRQLSATRRT